MVRGQVEWSRVTFWPLTLTYEVQDGKRMWSGKVDSSQRDKMVFWELQKPLPKAAIAWWWIQQR